MNETILVLLALVAVLVIPATYVLGQRHAARFDSMTDEERAEHIEENAW